MSFDLDDFISPDYAPEEVKEEKEKLPGLFDYINDLSFKKENLAAVIESKTGVFPSEFVPYITIKAFGNYPDTVLLANELNIRFGDIPAEAQYLFYLYGVPKRKRFAKFYSEDKDNTAAISALAKYFRWGSKEAAANLKMFTKQEIDEIIRRTDGNDRTEAVRGKRIRNSKHTGGN